jgi:hypothetical protein
MTQGWAATYPLVFLPPRTLDQFGVALEDEARIVTRDRNKGLVLPGVSLLLQKRARDLVAAPPPKTSLRREDRVQRTRQRAEFGDRQFLGARGWRDAGDIE